MKIKVGPYGDVNGYLGTIRMIGFYKDILYSGEHIFALVMWRWYIGVIM